MQIEVSGHAVERWVERVKPGLLLEAARAELEALVSLADEPAPTNGRRGIKPHRITRSLSASAPASCAKGSGMPEPRDNRCPECGGTKERAEIIKRGGLDFLCRDPFHTPAPPDQGCPKHGRSDCEECYLEALGSLAPPDHGEGERRWTIWKYADKSGVMGPETLPPEGTPAGNEWLIAARVEVVPAAALDQARAERDDLAEKLATARASVHDLFPRATRAEASLATAREALRKIVGELACHYTVIDAEPDSQSRVVTAYRTAIGALDSIPSDEGER